jgi:hypothetical protein
MTFANMIYFMKNKILLLSLVMMSSTLFMDAQRQISAQQNTWFMYFGNHRLSDKWGIHTEYQWRREDLGQNWQQSLMRVGVDYYIPDGPMLTAGYGWIQSFPYGEQPISYSFNEHRIWQQMILKQKAGRFYFNHRYRLEQRFLERKTLNSAAEFEHDEFVFRQRARYRFMVNIPLNHPEMKEKTLFLALYDEPFIQFGKGVGANTLDQNRLYGALGYQVNKSLQIQAGYLNQMVFKGDGVHAERNHNLQLGITYNMDFREK